MDSNSPPSDPHGATIAGFLLLALGAGLMALAYFSDVRSGTDGLALKELADRQMTFAAGAISALAAAVFLATGQILRILESIRRRLSERD